MLLKYVSNNVWKNFSQDLQIHTLLNKYLDHMIVKFNQNRMVYNIQNFELFSKKKKKMVNDICESFDVILANVSVT